MDNRQRWVDRIISNHLGFVGSWRARRDVDRRRIGKLYRAIRNYGEDRFASGICAGVVLSVFIGLLGVAVVAAWKYGGALFLGLVSFGN